MRWVRALVLPVLTIMIVACSGPAASQSTSGSEATDNPTSTVAESTPSPSATEDGGGGDGGGGGGDLDALIDDLTPPNSTQTMRTSASGGVFVAWDSTDSVDTLKGFYESAIPGTGMEIFSTSTAGGTYSWVFAESEGSSHGGSVTLGPASDGGSGASVIVTLTTE
jgi:hypothetical protein